MKEKDLDVAGWGGLKLGKITWLQMAARINRLKTLRGWGGGYGFMNEII